MPIALRWNNEARTILQFIFWNEWSLDEYIKVSREAVAMIQSTTRTVDILIDVRTGSFVPQGNTIRVFRQVMDELPDNAGIVVYVNDDDVQRRLFDIHTQFYHSLRTRQKRRFYMVQTLADAYRLIAEHRASR